MVGIDDNILWESDKNNIRGLTYRDKVDMVTTSDGFMLHLTMPGIFIELDLTMLLPRQGLITYRVCGDTIKT